MLSRITMKLRLTLLCLLTFIVFSCMAQTQEEKLILSTVGRMYSAVSFKDSASLKIDSILSVFTPEGVLIANFAQKPMRFSVKQYSDNLLKRVRAGELDAAQEKELFRKIDVFGNVAQVLSSYELTLMIKGKPVVRRGVNLIQLLKVDGKWFVSSLIWDRENENLRLPSKYVSNK